MTYVYSIRANDKIKIAYRTELKKSKNSSYLYQLGLQVPLVVVVVILVCATVDRAAAETLRFFFVRRNCHGRCCCFSRPVVTVLHQFIQRASVQTGRPSDVSGVDKLNRSIFDLRRI